MKRSLLAVLAVFFTFQAMGALIHNVILMDSYEATAHLWRDPQDMNLPMMVLITLILSTLFVWIYIKLVADKGTRQGLCYGFLLGLLMGISMSYFYFFSPIPCSMALTWFLGCLVEFSLAGLWVGLIIKGDKEELAA
ncbi:hypothetical protein ACFL5K_05050 [Gemmatimonadota bacterium]